MSAFICFAAAWLLGLIIGSADFVSSLLILSLSFLIPFSGAIMLSSQWLDNHRIPYGFILVICSGISLGLLHQNLQNPNPSLSSNPTVYFGKIRKIKTWGASDQMVVKLIAQKKDGQNKRSSGQVLLRRSGKSENQILCRDTISFLAGFKPLKKSKQIGEFDEAGYWAGYGIKDYAWISDQDIVHVIHSKNRPFLEFPSKIKNRLVRSIEQLLISETNQSLLLAMISGDKSYLGKEAKDLFSALGIMHLLAVSGLHLGLVYVIVSKLLMLFGLQIHSPVNRIISILIVWLYGLVCGLPASAIRAASMLSIYHIGRVFNRSVPGIFVVFLVAFLHTLLDSTVVFSAGFQLSYLAVLGILVFFPKISGLIELKNRILINIRDLVSMSISAQALTWPVSLILFAAFPTWFIISNLILMPIGILIFYSGLGLTFINMLGIHAENIDRYLDLLMKLWVRIGEAIASLPGGVIRVESFPWLLLGLYMSIVFFMKSGLRICVIRPFKILIMVVIWSLFGFFDIFVPNLLE